MADLLVATGANDPKRSPLVKLKEAQVEATELGYITATIKSESIFFAQQCKYTNTDLVEHNKSIHEHCKTVNGDGDTVLSPPTEVQVGDVFCLKYRFDNYWYRVQVRQCDNELRECEVNFVDYGNIETEISYDSLLSVNPRDLEAIERIPFGFYCKLQDFDKMDEKNRNLVLACLHEEYILLKAVERLDGQYWKIDIPKLAYNSGFWLAYESHKDKDDNKREIEVQAEAEMAVQEEATTSKAQVAT